MTSSSWICFRCDTAVVLRCKPRHTVFLRISPHTSEFEDLKLPHIARAPNLSIQNRTAVIQLEFETRNDKYNIIKCAAESDGLEALEREIMTCYDGVVLWDIDRRAGQV